MSEYVDELIDTNLVEDFLKNKDKSKSSNKKQKSVNMTSYHSKLVGVSFEGRQEIIANLSGDEELRFRREPSNEYDSNAVAVDVLISVDEEIDGKPIIGEWKPIGYIAKDNNSELAFALDSGKKASIQLSEITGDGESKHYGVNVYIEYEKKLKLVRSKDAKLVKDIFGNEIFYDNITHEYTNALGEVYLSGSTFAGQSESSFDAKTISNKMASKYGLSSDEAQLIQDMWELKSLASTSFGTSIHAAIELYGKYKWLAETLEKETHFHDTPVLKQAVSLFYEEHPDLTGILYECLVVDHKAKRAGRIDRLEYISDNEVYITDYKTNYDINKNLKKYWLQLSFYAAILKANGLTVAGLKIYHYTGDRWDTICGDVIDIDEVK